MDFAKRVMLENATSFKERREIMALTESDASKVNGSLISNLYKSAINKSHINFDSIPDSEGDIEKYEGYESMVQSLNLLDELAEAQKTKIPETKIVRTAINNINNLKVYYQRGIKTDNDFVVVQYNTLVMACVESTSLLISSYVDYLRQVNELEVKIVKNPKYNGGICLDCLERYNKMVIGGDLEKVLKADSSNNFVGISTAAVLTPALIAGGLLMILPLMRELIFYYYNTRMQIADYLVLQSQFLELNKQVVESKKNISVKEKNAILKKQQKVSNDLLKMADKIKVNHTLAEQKAKKELKAEEAQWSLSSLSSQSASTDSNGFAIL